MPLDPTSQDYFGSEASQLPGTRRGFGTVATQNVAPIIPAPTPPSSSGGSLAPPPVPSASAGNSLFASSAGRTLAGGSPAGMGQGVRLPAPAPPTPPPVTGGGRIVQPTDPTKPPATGGGSTTPPAPVAGQNPSQYVLALINAGLSPQDAVAKANADLGLGYGNSAVYYNDSRGQTIGLPEAYLAIGPDGKWGITPRMPEPGAGGIPTTGAPSGPLDLSSIDAFTDPSTQFLQDYVKTYMAQLLAPPYTDQATASLKAGPMNAIEASRQAEIQQAKESLASMGVSPSSGVVAATIQQINAKYDSLRAQSDNAFATSAISRTDAHQQQALSLAGLLADLPVQRLQVAEQAAGTGANPASIFAQLMNFSGLASQANLTQQQIQQQYQAAIGSILGSISSNFFKSQAPA